MSYSSGCNVTNKDLFNTPEETATRLALCLSHLKAPANIEEITALDLVATYMEAFGYGETNLHGDTPFARAEYEARRARVRKGINVLVVRGLATTHDGGITFIATDEGMTTSRALKGEYARNYQQAVSSLTLEDQEALLRNASRVGDARA